MYSFIPDAGMVGTIFVNAISNVIATAATNAQLSFEIDDTDQIEIVDCVGSNTHLKSTSWGANMTIGNLPYEQERSFVLRVKCKQGPPTDGSITATLKYVPVGDTKEIACSADGVVVQESTEIKTQ